MAELSIKCGNLFYYLEGKDLIINSTNKYMLPGSGICGGIYKMAGEDKLLEYIQNTFKTEMKVNEARFTGGFDLKIDILHIFCPKYYESLNPIEDLLESYRVIFREASKRNYKNIISVSLGTGVHAYKHGDVGKYVYKELESLVNQYNINFCLVLADPNTKKYYV